MIVLPIVIKKKRVYMEIKTTRKCKKCKNLIVLEYDKFTLYKEEYYHNDCFIESINEKRKKKLTQGEIMVMMDMLQEKNKNKIKDIVDKNHLFEYVTRKYELIYKPKYIYIKFEQVFNGTYKNLSEVVSPEDLLDMWQRKESYLDKTYQWKVVKGEGLNGLNRMWYDLAIVLSKVGSYRKWQDEQKKNEKQAETKLSGINLNKIDLNITQNIVREKDFSDYLEEI
jgi:hypothetical protein